MFKLPDGCWIWLGLVTRNGYGRLSWNRPGLPGLRRAHRVAFAIFKGEPGSLCVCHKCDNPGCCNPDHLFLGTNADNMSDRNAKGRQAKGVGNGTHKLTVDQVLEIRRLVAGGMTQSDVASHYGVTRRLVNFIINGKLWTHI